MEKINIQVNISDVDIVYKARQLRLQHPDGRFDDGGRWYPSSREFCSCCKDIRRPSRAYPMSLNIHCRTRKHIESLKREHSEYYEVVYTNALNVLVNLV
jgi:hypothetical protein